MKADAIEGWQPAANLAWLAEQAKRANVIVELGVWKGKSTACRAEHTSGVVFAVDHFLGSEDERETFHAEAASPEGSASVLAQAKANLAEFIDAGKVFLLQVESGTAAGIVLADVLAHRQADLIFIDGTHTPEAVQRDIVLFSGLVRAGGILCGDDCEKPGVKQAIDEILPGWQRHGFNIWSWQND